MQGSRPHQVTPEPDAGGMASGHRDPGDDFYCLRYDVWYSSFDCAIRTKFKTCSGCLVCEQGRFNLQRHRIELGRLRRRWPLDGA